MSFTKLGIAAIFDSIQEYHFDMNEFIQQHGDPIVEQSGSSANYIWRFVPDTEAEGQDMWKLVQDGAAVEPRIDLIIELTATGQNSVLMNKHLSLKNVTTQEEPEPEKEQATEPQKDVYRSQIQNPDELETLFTGVIGAYAVQCAEFSPLPPITDIIPKQIEELRAYALGEKEFPNLNEEQQKHAESLCKMYLEALLALQAAEKKYNSLSDIAAKVDALNEEYEDILAFTMSDKISFLDVLFLLNELGEKAALNSKVATKEDCINAIATLLKKGAGGEKQEDVSDEMLNDSAVLIMSAVVEGGLFELENVYVGPKPSRKDIAKLEDAAYRAEHAELFTDVLNVPPMTAKYVSLAMKQLNAFRNSYFANGSVLEIHTIANETLNLI